MKKQLFQILGLMLVMVIVVIFSMGSLRGGTAFGITSILPQSNRQESTHAPVIRQVKTLFSQAKKSNTDFSQSPCISEDMGNGYALDIIHDPLIEADTQNQCSTYQDGKIAGLVEITPEGKIRNILD